MHGPTRALQNIVDHLLESRAGQLDRQVLRTGRVGRQERQVDLGLEQRRELDLRLLRRFLQALQRHLVLRKVDALLFLELLDQPVDDALVDVVAAEVRVAVGRLHFDHAVADFENRDVERAAAEVVDRDRLVLLLVEAVGQRGRRRLVDDAHHFEAGDLPGVFGRLALRVVEVGRNRDDRLRDLLAQIGFGRFLQLAQNHRRDLGRRILLALNLDAGVAVVARDDLVGNQLHFFADFVEAAAHEALDRINRVFRVGDGLPLRHLADQPLAALGERHHRRRGAATFLVRDDGRLAAFHHRDDRIRGSEVNSDNLAHVMIPPPMHLGRISQARNDRLAFSTSPLSNVSLILSTCLQRFFIGAFLVLSLAPLACSASLTIAAAADLSSAESDLLTLLGGLTRRIPFGLFSRRVARFGNRSPTELPTMSSYPPTPPILTDWLRIAKSCPIRPSCTPMGGWRRSGATTRRTISRT